MTRRRILAAPILCIALAGCGAVNPEAGQPASDRFALLERDAGPPGEPNVSAGTLLLGSYPEDITGSITYLGETTSLSGRGTVTIGPGPGPGETLVNRYHGDAQFPYEVVTLATTDRGHFLTSIQVTNPVDMRVALQCTLTEGITIDPGGEPHDVRGHCAGGTTLSGTTAVVDRRPARWQNRDIELLTTRTEITFDGFVTGTLVEVNQVPEGQNVALHTQLDVDVDQNGMGFQQELERSTIPAVEER